MRTTIDIPDELHRELKAKAALQGRSVKDLVLGLIEAEVRSGDAKGERVKLPLIKAKKKGAFNLTREEIHDAMFG